MKHISVVSSATPATAGFPTEHPNLVDSILAFLEDPEAVLALHKKDVTPV